MTQDKKRTGTEKRGSCTPSYALETRALSMCFEEGSSGIINEVSLNLVQGELLLLLGPSGGGKSSLALCLNGIYPHAVDSLVCGEVRLYNELLLEANPAQIAQRVGIVFQDVDSQFCMLRVEEELAFCLENIGCPRDEMEARIVSALGLAGLSDYRQAYIHSLSGGMKQQLAIACALVLRPSILILDEPTSNLDPIAATALTARIREIQQAEELTVLLIEHQLDEWMYAVDRIAALDQRGSLFYQGLPREYFRRYSSKAQELGIWQPRAATLHRQLIKELAGRVSADSNAESAKQQAMNVPMSKENSSNMLATKAGYTEIQTLDRSAEYEQLLLSQHEMGNWQAVEDALPLTLNELWQLWSNQPQQVCKAALKAVSSIREHVTSTQQKSRAGELEAADISTTGVFDSSGKPPKLLLAAHELVYSHGRSPKRLYSFLKKRKSAHGEISATPAQVTQATKATKATKATHQIHHVSLHVHEGEFVALAGPNGAGKSTLASLLTGLLAPASGHVYVNGRRLDDWREEELRRQIGLVFQHPEHQFVTDSVYDELAYTLRLRQEWSEGQIEKRVEAVLKQYRLEEQRDMSPFSLSQGQKRRLSVAVMLMDDQRILICDEPTYGQDAYASLELMQALRSRAEQGQAVLMITHDMEWVRQFATRVIVLQAGHIVFDDTPVALWKLTKQELDMMHLKLPLVERFSQLLSDSLSKSLDESPKESLNASWSGSLADAVKASTIGSSEPSVRQGGLR
ncbi:ABC transporter ATP-binding protein [Paenibacillus massiliensis]|uniref:ABC transporter ATP-binding protein n=1 Tax=Paenibacillus massiliensis TaxID=225917 RepID=UPI000A003A44|nr:ABC transporter ATP-binding protein [Paenibacillus massiliensis]